MPTYHLLRRRKIGAQLVYDTLGGVVWSFFYVWRRISSI